MTYIAPLLVLQVLIFLLIGCNSLQFYRPLEKEMTFRLFASNKLKPMFRERASFLEDGRDNLEMTQLLNESQMKQKDAEETSENGPPLTEMLILLLVPISWGTYTPLVKHLYSSPDITTPPFLIFNFLTYIVSLSSISSVKALQDLNSQKDDEDTLIASAHSSDQENTEQGGENRRYWLGLSRLEVNRGLELGAYLFIGSSLQVLGIQTISAIKASVLVQCTTVVVPLLDGVLNKKSPSARAWGSSLLALLGVLIISIENPMQLLENGVDISALAESGSFFTCVATIFYSLHVVRLGQVASKVNALNLARVKSGTELILAGSVLAVTISILGMTEYGSAYRHYIADFVNTVFTGTQTPVLAAILWNGMISTAFTIWAQTVAQRNISSTTANIVYSSQPIWASLFSVFLLKEEFTDNLLLGSSVLAAAILLIVTERIPEERR